ncbi:MAG TPA: asparagine synthase (glutamine-hydrolyzing) [Gemmatimonadaceae bacterium]|nr:asparagine synthase (glutamine-hydrolyzing) [Gemmatimonadaceae bacterium]
MCGIAGIVGAGWERAQLDAMVVAQTHRGPDAHGVYLSPSARAGLGHTRLSIIDLSPAGAQPMSSRDGTLQVVFNGEIYNYLELRAELSDYPYSSHSDTEVLLAAYERWGPACLDRLIGMFAFLIWDERRARLFAARDRFGVKPLYYHVSPDGYLALASEIQALHAAGVPREPDPIAWATYLAHGLYDHTPRTFWQGIAALPAGCRLEWDGGAPVVTRWYDLADRVPAVEDPRSEDAVADEYLALLRESVALRFRADVPVGINLSGGLDSSTLLGLVQAIQGEESDVTAFTFITGDPAYDELPWVRHALARTHHPLAVCRLESRDVPRLAAAIHAAQGEPFGGLPTIAYATVFERAREEGTLVLLDGQGLDEQWAGYGYYARAVRGEQVGIVQGTRNPVARPDCLVPEFRRLAEPLEERQPFSDALRNLQYRDAVQTKMPRALRFNDRISMHSSVELREPFLDHRLFELALAQPAERKIRGDTGKWLLRRIAGRLMGPETVEAPKRALQTPQREWLRGPLREWADAMICTALESTMGEWLDAAAVSAAWRHFLAGETDNSFFVWQWISMALLHGEQSCSTPVQEVRCT